METFSSMMMLLFVILALPSQRAGCKLGSPAATAPSTGHMMAPRMLRLAIIHRGEQGYINGTGKL